MPKEINSWDDAADWTSEASLAGASICDCLNAVRLAILERANSINGSVVNTNALAEPFKPMDDVRTSIVTLLDELNRLCVYFINPSDEDAQLKFDIGFQRGEDSNFCTFSINQDDPASETSHTLKSRYEDREYVVTLNGGTLTVNATGKDGYTSVPVVYFNLYAGGSSFLDFCDAAGINRSKYSTTRSGRNAGCYCIDRDGAYLRSIAGTLKDMYDVINLLTLPMIDYQVRISTASTETYQRSAWMHYSDAARTAWYYNVTDGSGSTTRIEGADGDTPENVWGRSRWNGPGNAVSSIYAGAEMMINITGGFKLARSACLPAVYTNITNKGYNVPLSYSYELDASFRKTSYGFLDEEYTCNSKLNLLSAAGRIQGTQEEASAVSLRAQGVFGKSDAIPSGGERDGKQYDWLLCYPELACTLIMPVLAQVNYAFRETDD